MKLNTILKDNYYQKQCLQILFVWLLILTTLLLVTMGLTIGTLTELTKHIVETQPDSITSLEQLDKIEIQEIIEE